MALKSLFSKKNKPSVKLKDFLVPAVLDNSSENGSTFGQAQYQTKDLVFVRSLKEIEKLSNAERMKSATDFAVFRGAELSYSKNLGDRYSCKTYTRTSARSFTFDRENMIIDTNGTAIKSNQVAEVVTKCVAIAPCIHLDCKKTLQAKKELGMFEVKTYTDSNKIVRHTLQFGSFPQTYVGDELDKVLSNLYNKKKLKATGKHYLTYQLKNTIEHSPEYEYKGNKYVLMFSSLQAKNGFLKSGKEILFERGYEKVYFWIKVEPIEWEIANWNDLPTEFNPYGTGKASFIDLTSSEGLLAGIFNYYTIKDKYSWMWQNSIIRQALNGYDIRQELANGNGDINLHAMQDYHCKGQGFVDQAFEEEVPMEFNTESAIVGEQTNSQNSNKTLSPAEQARNELIKKALERKKQAQQSNDNSEDNENTF